MYAAGEVIREDAGSPSALVFVDWRPPQVAGPTTFALRQSLHPPCDGRADVGLFFALYAEIDGVSLASAWLEDREVVAVFEDRADPKPSA